MKQFTFVARQMLSEMLTAKQTYREISAVIGIAISSISEELRRNSEQGRYDPHRAHQKALERQAAKRKRAKLEISPGLKHYVIDKLREDWSPEEIADVLRKEADGKPVISHETIYLFIYSEEGKALRLGSTSGTGKSRNGHTAAAGKNASSSRSARPISTAARSSVIGKAT